MLLDTLRSVCNVVVTKLALYTGIAVLALACTWILYRAFYRLVWSGHVSVRDSEGRPRHVLVTGCDSGFGNGLARQLHAKGFHVHAGCLFQKSATALEGELGDRLHGLHLDVTSDRDVQLALESVTAVLEETGGELLAIVNNAGILGGAHIEWTDVRTFERVMDVNHTGGIRITKAFMPFLLKSRGRVVNVTSAAGFSATKGIAPYAASKFAFEAFSDSLRLEMAPWGVKVSIIEPGFFNTPIVQRAADNLDKVYRALPDEMRERWGDEWWAARQRRVQTVSGLAGDPAEVVKTMAEAVTAKYPLPRYQVGWDCKIIYNVFFHLPTVTKDMLDRLLNGDGMKPAALRHGAQSRKDE